MYDYRDRIQGHYSQFFPRDSKLAEKIVEDDRSAKRILHTSSTITYQKGQKSLLPLQEISINEFNNSPLGELPEDRTIGSKPFEVIGVDYAATV